MKVSLGLLACFSFLLPLAAAENKPIPQDPAANAELKATLRTKIFEKVDFANTTLTGCIAWLKEQGLPIELSPDAAKDGKETTLTLTLRNVPAIEVIKYVTNLANMKYVIENGKIVVSPLTVEGVGGGKDAAPPGEA